MIDKNCASSILPAATQCGFQRTLVGLAIGMALIVELSKDVRWILPSADCLIGVSLTFACH
jgi:hypothetical protein